MQVCLLNTENYQAQSGGGQEVLACVILSAGQLSHSSYHFHTFECSILTFKLNCLKNTFFVLNI